MPTHHITLTSKRSNFTAEEAAAEFTRSLTELKARLIINGFHQSTGVFIPNTNFDKAFDIQRQSFDDRLNTVTKLSLSDDGLQVLVLQLNVLALIGRAMRNRDLKPVSSLRAIDLMDNRIDEIRTLDPQKIAGTIQLWSKYAHMLGTPENAQTLEEALIRTESDINWIDILRMATKNPAMKTFMAMLERFNEHSTLTLSSTLD